MSPEIVCITGLVVFFTLGTILPVNMGALALASAFIVGVLYLGFPLTDIFSGFPGDLFVTLVGITYLFAIANNNGTVDWLVRQAVRAVGGRNFAIPWVIFFVSGTLTAMGAVSPGAVAIIAPIALRFAQLYRISPILMGLMVIHGAQAGGFSPISVYGGITNQVVERAGIQGDAVHLFLASLVFNFLIAVIVFLFFGGRRLIVQHANPDTALEAGDRPDPSHAETLRVTGSQLLTLLSLLALGIGTLVFDLNVGLTSITLAVILTLLSPKAQSRAIEQVSWSTVLLVCGVVTYVAVMQKAGTITFIGNGVSSMGAPLLAALFLCYIGGLVSAFASTVGVLGATIPLALPLLMLGHLDPVAVIAALAVSSSIVDVSPFSTNGALVVANAQGVDKQVFYRQLLAYSGVVVLLGPLMAWALFVVPGW